MTYSRTWIFHRRPRSRALYIQLLALAALSLLAPSTIATADPSGKDGLKTPKYTFGLWGDMPYTQEQANKIPALINDMNAAKLAFSVFDGDIKSGSSLCTDDVYTTAIGRFNSFAAPMIYVPGDNEWTDCHRLNNGGYNNLERLDHIRRTMFVPPYSVGQKTLLLDPGLRWPGGARARRYTFFQSGQAVDQSGEPSGELHPG